MDLEEAESMIELYIQDFDASNTHMSITWILYSSIYDIWIYNVLLIEQSPLGLFNPRKYTAIPFQTNMFEGNSGKFFLSVDILKVIAMISLALYEMILGLI